MERPNLYSVREIAEYLSVHEITIYRMLKGGMIPAVKVGGQWRFDISAIDSWLNAKSGKASPGPSDKKGHRGGIPKALWKYFWDTEPAGIDLNANKEYVLERLLEYGDADAAKWMKRKFDINELKDVVRRSSRISARSANYWRLVLNISKESIACLRKSSSPRQGVIWK